MIRFLTAGESHGKSLTAIVEGFPSNLELTKAYIDFHLKRRQAGYGRGQRMKIESDNVEIIAGIRFGKTIGSPICLTIKNQDWENVWVADNKQYKSDTLIELYIKKFIDFISEDQRFRRN